MVKRRPVAASVRCVVSLLSSLFRGCAVLAVRRGHAAMIYDWRVQRVAPPRAVLADVALRRRKRGEECCQQEECWSSTHAESVYRGASISSQRAWHEDVSRSYFHNSTPNYFGSKEPAKSECSCPEFLASVLLNASASCCRLKTQAGKGARSSGPRGRRRLLHASRWRASAQRSTPVQFKDRCQISWDMVTQIPTQTPCRPPRSSYHRRREEWRCRRRYGNG